MAHRRNGCCDAVTLVFAILFLLVSVTVSLLLRLFLHGYFSCAHVAALSAFPALFVIARFSRCSISCLGCPSLPYDVCHIILNLIYLLGFLCIGGAYFYLAMLALNYNFDHISAAIWAFVAALFMVYLLVVAVSSARGNRSSSYRLTEESDKKNKNSIPMYRKDYAFTGSTESDTSLVGSEGDGKGRKCCVVCWRIFFGLLYILFHVILLLILTASVYYPVTVIRDIAKYREDDNMHTVKVEGHRPLAMFMKCDGNGSETILFEAGLGGSAYMYWDFIPRILSTKYTVCITDRRGYGWSEGLDSDFIQAEKEDPQWARTNVQFLTKLIETVNMSTPFYYAGHSYGGYHLTFMALDHPQMVKGLIYLDSSKFSAVEDIFKLVPLLTNAQPTGFLRVALDLGFMKPETLLGELLMLSELQGDNYDRYIASLVSGGTSTAIDREQVHLVQTDYAKRNLQSALKDKVLSVPVQVIDAVKNVNSTAPAWFPAQHFIKYNSSYHHVVYGASHTMLTNSLRYANETAALMDSFIQSVNQAS